MFKIFSIVTIGILFLGCGEEVTRYDKSQNQKNIKDETQQSKKKSENIITNGLQKLALQKNEIIIYSFVMSNRGYVTLETDTSKCDIKLLTERGKTIQHIYRYNYKTNIETPKGTNFIKVEAIDEDCHRFTLFSPMILDNFTNENRTKISNGEQEF